ncbi:AraC family transcriptional regulator [Endozoicomonas sp. Mp262]|uniref:AraC family transcriptional regulator n=1 Tax=Endozoicomonas sp. Mp262 TaxID=2919499 RepID=UPI0021D9E3A4
MLELVNVGTVKREELLGTCEKSLTSETLVMVATGTINVSGPDFELTINEHNPVLLPAGTYLLSNKQKLNEDACQLIFISLSVNFITHLIEKYGALFNRENSFQVYGYNQLHINHLLEHAIILIANNIVEKSPANAHLIALKVEEIFLLMLSQPQGEHFEQTLKWIGSSSSRRLRRFMNENYRKNWSLEQFASEFNTSLSSFKSLFNKIYRTTPKAWINEMRLQYAYNQLVG